MIEESHSPRQDDQFKEFFGVLRRRKAFVIGGVVLFAALGAVSIALSSPSYQVVTRVLLQNYGGSNFKPSTNPVDRVKVFGAPPEIGAQISLLQSPKLVGDALAAAGVTINAGDELAKSVVVVEQESTTPVLNVQVNLPNPEDATKLALAIPDTYNRAVQAQNDAQLKDATSSLRDKVVASRADLNRAQAAYEKFLASQGAGGAVSADVNEGAQRTARLNGFETQLESARVSESSAESALREALLAQSKIPREILDKVVRPSNERIAAAEANVADLEGQLNSLLAIYSPQNEQVRSLKARLDRAKLYRKTLPAKVDASGPVRNPERAVYDQRVAEAQGTLAAARSSVAKLIGIVATERAALGAYQRRLPQQRRLENDLTQKKELAESLSRSLTELGVVSNSKQDSVQTLQTFSPLKTQPAIGRTMIASTLIGLIFGIVAALLRDRFDNRVHTLEQLYDVSGMVPIGEVPVSGRPLALETGRGRNRVLESYRSLRFNIESAGSTEPVQSVLVASASAGEGRASLSLNLATEAATDMKKTIVVDGDMRNPELHDRLKLVRGPGLSDVLSGTIALQDALQKTGQENLLLLSAGSEHLNPLELLTGPSFIATHEALKEMADVIIFNSPSMMRFTDGRAIAKVVDSVIFVAKRGFTRRDAMRYCLGMLRRAKTHLLGVVLVDERGRATDVPGYATE